MFNVKQYSVTGIYWVILTDFTDHDKFIYTRKNYSTLRNYIYLSFNDRDIIYGGIFEIFRNYYVTLLHSVPQFKLMKK